MAWWIGIKNGQGAFDTKGKFADFPKLVDKVFNCHCVAIEMLFTVWGISVDVTSAPSYVKTNHVTVVIR